MRRANGTGTIVNMGKNRRRPFAVRISCRDKRGRPAQKYLSFHATPKEAQQALEDYNRNSVATSADQLTMTLQQAYDIWSARKYAKAGIASVASYKASWGRLAVVGRVRMRDITIDQLQAIIDADEYNGLSASSISNDRMLMKALYKYAMERDIVRKDLSTFIELPSIGAKHEKGAFTDLQMKHLEQMAAAGFPWADAVLMLCYTGFRITEFLSLTRFSHKDGLLCGGMKTEAGKNRTVPVHPKVAPYLSAWLSKGGDAIICGTDGKGISSAWFREYAFKLVAEELGVSTATPHWCRHTFASMAKKSGVDELAVRRIMGHANKDITEHYTHSDANWLSKELQKMA